MEFARFVDEAELFAGDHVRRIPGHSEYAVSRDGNDVFSCRWKGFSTATDPNFGRWRKLSRFLSGYGYWATSVCDDKGVRRTHRIHVLVLLAFVGPRPEGYDGCHNNGVRTDNRVENLRWDTPASNHADARRHGTAPIGERSPHAKLTAEQVRQIVTDRQVGVSAATLAKRYGVTRRAVREIMAGRNWRSVTADILGRLPVPRTRIKGERRTEGEGLATVPVSDIWLRQTGDYVQVLARYKGRWVVVCSEPNPGGTVASAVVTESAIRHAPLDPVTESDSLKSAFNVMPLSN